jgi:predicted GNAT family acetyltransferase
MTKVRMLANCLDLAEYSSASPVSEFAVEQLAELMVDAYRGTTDWEDGDDEIVAAAEIRATTSASNGQFNSDASGVIADSSGLPVSALFVSHLEGLPTILFVYTAKSAAGEGHATTLIKRAAAVLAEQGHDEVVLYVSEENPARMLYQNLGFA